MAIDKTSPAIPRLARVEPTQKDRPARQDHLPKRRSARRPLEPAASLELTWRCPVCQAFCTLNKKNPDEAPICPVALRYPKDHADLADLQTRAREQQCRALAEILHIEADQRAHRLLHALD